MERINEKLGAWLLEPNHNRKQLAKKLGLTTPTLNTRIRGETRWMWEEVLAIAELLNCTPNDLAGI